MLIALLVLSMPSKEVHDTQTGLHALAYIPPTHSGPLPLLLYLHGAGESGTRLADILSQGATGTPPVELERGTALPVLARHFVVVAPQTDHGWQAEEVNSFMDFLLHRAPPGFPALDASRCYVTGHSMGGAGALAAATTKRFAAVVPVAPAGAPSAATLHGVPVWAFHGRNDIVVPASISERLVNGLRRKGADDEHARLTIYDEAPAPRGWPDYVGHGSPILAYQTPELWQWLLEQRTSVNS